MYFRSKALVYFRSKAFSPWGQNVDFEKIKNPIMELFCLVQWRESNERLFDCFPPWLFSLSSKGFDYFPSAVPLRVLLRVLLRQAPEPLCCRLSLTEVLHLGARCGAPICDGQGATDAQIIDEQMSTERATDAQRIHLRIDDIYRADNVIYATFDEQMSSMRLWPPDR